MSERRRLTRMSVWVAVIVTASLLAAATYALAAAPEASIRFAPAQAAVTANAMAWQSGWVSINQGQRLALHHNLGRDPEDLAVEMWFNDTAGAGWGINRLFYGGVDDHGHRVGAHWERLTNNDITVYRDLDDTAADQVFVAVWVANRGPDDYDSGWVNINAGLTKTFTHHSSAAIPVADLTVGLWFKNTAPGGPGINQWYYGGKEIAGDWVGAYWFNLTATTVKVRRAVDDTGVNQVRIVVVHRATPDFDESMSVVKGLAMPVDHDLDWEPTMLQVVAQCKSNITAIGINQLGTGGNYGTSAPFPGWQGAAIQSLTADQLTLYRFSNDTVCDQIRVRIWKRYDLLNLPAILRED